MRDRLAAHPYFVPWTDPDSGVVSYLLNERVAPVQLSFYFTNASFTPSQDWLWFYAAQPPGPARMLGAVNLDPDHPEIRFFPHAQFSAASPLLTRTGDGVFFAARTSVYRMDLEGRVTEALSLPADWLKGRPCKRISTHLTQSADGTYLLLDGDIGSHWWVGLGNLETGEVTILKEFGRHYNHAQFSPTDPSLFSIAQDWWLDPDSGLYFDYDQRIWLMDIHNSRFEPLLHGAYTAGGRRLCHEWWAADGTPCWIDYDRGAYEGDLFTREATHVWQRPLCHAHCNSDRTLWCADQSPYAWPDQPCAILFYDRAADRDIAVVSGMPPPPVNRGWYHLDPHPQFSPRGDAIVYGTTVRGTMDVAIATIADIRDRMT